MNTTFIVTKINTFQSDVVDVSDKIRKNGQVTLIVICFHHTLVFTGSICPKEFCLILKETALFAMCGVQ